jgi:hypothetical protein
VVRGQRHAPAAIYPRERPGTPCTGGWVGPRAGLDRCGKSHPHRCPISNLPARNQLLYWLSYQAHTVWRNETEICYTRSQLPRGVKRGSAAARLRGLWARIQPGQGYLSVVNVVLSGTSLWDRSIIRPEDSYRVCVCFVCACVREREIRKQ